jgi:hypothetical protein
MSVSTNVSGHHIKVKVLWYSILYKREDIPSRNQHDSEEPKARRTISKLEASREGHDVVRVDLAPNGLQPRQIRPIQRLDRRPEKRVVPILRDVDDVLTLGDGRRADRVRALQYGRGDLGVFLRRGPREVDVRRKERAGAVGRVCGRRVGVVEYVRGEGFYVVRYGPAFVHL